MTQNLLQATAAAADAAEATEEATVAYMDSRVNTGTEDASANQADQPMPESSMYVAHACAIPFALEPQTWLLCK